MLAVGLHRGSN